MPDGRPHAPGFAADGSIEALPLVRSLFPLCRALVARDISARYRGTMLGFLWPVLNPLLLLAIFSFFYQIVLGVRWPGAQAAPDYTLMLYCGIIVHGMFAECVGRAPALVAAHPTYVKRVVFPLEALGIVVVAAAVFQAAINVVILLGFTWWQRGELPATALLIPVVLAPYVLVLLGLAWFLSSLGTYFRDLQHAMPIVSLAAMFVSPIFYPVSAVPAQFRPLLDLNPLTVIIEQLRVVVLGGRVPDLPLLGAYALAGAAFALAGWAWFRRTRSGFAELV